MPANCNKPEHWEPDILRSVDFYNDWYMGFAPDAFISTRIDTTAQVEDLIRETEFMTSVTPAILKQHPTFLQILRMTTAPPIARDRLIGLAQVTSGLVKSMEDQNRTPPRINPTVLDDYLERICLILLRMRDTDLFPWLGREEKPTKYELFRASTIVSDRMTGARSDPLIRNAQERRQLNAIREWLEAKGYSFSKSGTCSTFIDLEPGTFAFRMNVPVTLTGTEKTVNIPVDSVIKPFGDDVGDLPVLIEAKSAGDYTNPNKRRKEEAVKVKQLRKEYGEDVRFLLFLCGYFNVGYLEYEAAEGIDWIWEHRIDDLAIYGV